MEHTEKSKRSVIKINCTHADIAFLHSISFLNCDLRFRNDHHVVNTTHRQMQITADFFSLCKIIENVSAPTSPTFCTLIPKTFGIPQVHVSTCNSM